jgi:hypothetical protein
MKPDKLACGSSLDKARAQAPQHRKAHFKLIDCNELVRPVRLFDRTRPAHHD